MPPHVPSFFAAIPILAVLHGRSIRCNDIISVHERINDLNTNKISAFLTPVTDASIATVDRKIHLPIA